MLVSAWVHKIQRNLEDYGWPATLWKALQRALAPIFFRNVYRLYRIELVSAPREATPAAKRFSFRLLTAEAEREIEELETNYEWFRGSLKKRLAGAISA